MSSPATTVQLDTAAPPRPRRRRPARESLRALWAARGLLGELIRRDLRVRYAQALLGVLWAVLLPAFVVGAGVLVRLAVVYAGGGPRPGTSGITAAMLGATAVKAVPWAFFVGALNFATPTLAGNAGLMSKVYFPREVLPLAAVLGQAVDLSAAALVVGLLSPLLGLTLSPALLWAVPLLVLLLLFTAGAALALSCANLFFRDVRYLVQVALTFGVFFTPVLADAGSFGSRAARLLMLNPIAPVLEGLRLALVNGHDLLRPLVAPNGALEWTPWYLAYAAAWAVAAAVGGARLFWRLERSFAEFA